MKTSVIIPTYNGAHKIVNLLTALEKQSVKDFEVIVIIDGSTDGTKDKLEQYRFNFQSFRIIEQVNQGRSIVRNNGAKAAQFSLFVFFDDDMIPTEDCIKTHIEHHKRKPGSILTGGLTEDYLKCKTDIQRYKAYLSDKWTVPLRAYQDKALPKEAAYVTAANFSISKETFLALGGFDENLRDAEDFDLAVRAYQKNISLFYNQEAFAWHDDFITCYSYINRQKEYQAMHKKLLNQKPDLFRSYSLRELKMPKGIKGIIFKLFKFKFWIWTIDNLNWLVIIPQKLRYKIYDVVIMSNSMHLVGTQN